MTVTGKADSQQLTLAILTSKVVQIVTNVVAEEADYFGREIIAIRESRIVASVAVHIFD